MEASAAGACRPEPQGNPSRSGVDSRGGVDPGSDQQLRVVAHLALGSARCACLIIIAVLIARSGRRGPKAADVWQSRALDAYAQGAALYDAMRMAEAPGALIAPDAAARWADIQRRADDLGQSLYAMREAAPDEDKRMRTADVLAALQAVRTAMAAERGTDVSQVPPPDQVRSRLQSFRAALQALREPDDRMPY